MASLLRRDLDRAMPIVMSAYVGVAEAAREAAVRAMTSDQILDYAPKNVRDVDAQAPGVTLPGCMSAPWHVLGGWLYPRVHRPTPAATQDLESAHPQRLKSPGGRSGRHGVQYSLTVRGRKFVGGDGP